MRGIDRIGRQITGWGARVQKIALLISALRFAAVCVRDSLEWTLPRYNQGPAQN